MTQQEFNTIIEKEDEAKDTLSEIAGIFNAVSDGGNFVKDFNTAESELIDLEEAQHTIIRAAAKQLRVKVEAFDFYLDEITVNRWAVYQTMIGEL